MSLIKFPIYTKEELRQVIDKLLEAGNTFMQIYNWLDKYSYQYWAETDTYDIYYYGKCCLRYRNNYFVMYL